MGAMNERPRARVPCGDEGVLDRGRGEMREEPRPFLGGFVTQMWSRLIVRSRPKNAAKPCSYLPQRRILDRSERGRFWGPRMLGVGAMSERPRAQMPCGDENVLALGRGKMREEPRPFHGEFAA